MIIDSRPKIKGSKLSLMSQDKSSKIINYSVIISSAAIFLIFISLIPISQKAIYWNQCLRKTYQWLDKYEEGLRDWDKASKESIAVAVCNGAVYEPKFKTN